MKKSKKASDTKVSKIKRKITKGASLAICAVMIFSAAGCSKSKPDDGKTVSVDEAYFSSVQLDISSAIKGEYASIECAKQFRDNFGIVILGTTQYFIQLYDTEGKLVSQTALEAAIDPRSNLINMADDADDNLHVLTQYFNDTTEIFVSELFTFDSTGALVGEPIEIPDIESFSETKMEVDNSGNIYLYYSSVKNGTRGITVFNSSGTKLYDIPEPNGIYFGNFLLMNEQMYASVYDYSSGNFAIGLYPIDNEKEKLGDPLDATATLGTDSGLLNWGKDGLFSTNAKGVYSVNLEDQEKTLIFLWNNTDYKKAAAFSDQAIVLSANTTIVVKKSDSGDDSIVSVSLLKRADVNPDAGKKIITIAGCMVSLDSAVVAAVHDFNMNSKKYRVEIHEYYGNPLISSNTSSVVSTMNLEILSGNAPDIIYGDNELFTNCENKGILVDLYTMMANDSEFNKDDIIPSILKICETDGHLYKIGTGFILNGFVGAKSLIGDRTGWTVDEFESFAESLPDKMVPLTGFTQSDLLYKSLTANMNSYIDTKLGTVRFDSDDFRKLLDYVKKYGYPDSGSDAYSLDSIEMIANGEQAMKGSGICSPTSYAQEIVLFGEPISVTGYPSSERSTAACYMPTMLAIYFGSENKEAAWEFFKYFYTEEAQKALISKNVIPVLTSVFEGQIKTELNPDPNTGGFMFLDHDGNPVTITIEMAVGYRELIYGLHSLGSYDSEIREIVLEEAAPYFYDQKSQNDVIALIQDRVQTLMDERQ